MLEKDFPLLQKKNRGKPLIYLDNSATTQKPTVVIKTLKDFYENYNANVHRGIYTLSEQATLRYEDARKKVADFIHAAPEEIIFTSGTTASLNGLAISLGKKLHAGDEIVLSIMEHHSNLVPWQQLAQEKGLVLKFIPITADYRLDLNRAKQYITPKTKIVTLTQMSNVLGTINPIKEIAALAHFYGATMIVDAAQSLPHIPIDVKKLNCDFLAFSGHKVYGPTGIGVLYGRKEFLQKLDPFAFGGGMIQEVTLQKSTWAEIPHKFEAGTPPLAEAMGLAAALDYLQKADLKKIIQQEQKLASYALKKLATISQLKIIGPASMQERGPVISFVIEGVHPHDVSEILNRDNIAVRGGHHCALPLHRDLNLLGTVRASFSFYNQLSDVDALVRGIKKALGILKK